MAASVRSSMSVFVLFHRQAGILRSNNSSISAAARLDAYQYGLTQWLHRTSNSPLCLRQVQPESNHTRYRRTGKDECSSKLEVDKQRRGHETDILLSTDYNMKKERAHQVMMAQEAPVKRPNVLVLTMPHHQSQLQSRSMHLLRRWAEGSSAAIKKYRPP